LWNDEIDYMVLEGGMVALACLCLTFAHPGYGFCGSWSAADFRLRNRNVKGRGVQRNEEGDGEVKRVVEVGKR
jgi:hypothetical protein